MAEAEVGMVTIEATDTQEEIHMVARAEIVVGQASSAVIITKAEIIIATKEVTSATLIPLKDEKEARAATTAVGIATKRANSTTAARAATATRTTSDRSTNNWFN